MHVDEFKAEFDRLSKFIVFVVLTNGSRANQCEEGLHGHIQHSIVGFHLTTYNEVMSHAKAIDSMWKGIKSLDIVR